MKKILFIGILAIISSAPAYPAAGGHGAVNSAGHSSGGRQMGAVSSGAISNNAVTPRHHKKAHPGGPAVQDVSTMELPRRHRHRRVQQTDET